MKCPRCKLVWKVKAYADGGKIRWRKMSKEQRLAWVAKVQEGRRKQLVEARLAKMQDQFKPQQS